MEHKARQTPEGSQAERPPRECPGKSTQPGEEQCKDTDRGTEVACSGSSRVFRLTEVRDCRQGQKQTGQGHRGQTALQAEQESVPESLSGSE